MNPAPTPPIRLLVVDDHNLFRRGLIALLAQDARFEVVGEAADASQALQVLGQQRPDLVLLDNHMPGVLGVQAIADLKRAQPGVRVLMLTVSENVEDLAAGLRAGADGYLVKTINTDALCDSIQRVWDGDSVISPEMMGKLVGLLRHPPDTPSAAPANPAADSAPAAARSQALHALNPKDPIHTLSPRESEILKLITKGDSNKHIARALGIAETTVKIHVQHILRKLNLSNRVHAAVYASERGLS
ncbi:MAG: response regulator transcription factor [Betaproteobacteria bacterium]|nr:response regulator transcription factor [Betaproteobacteria bacterium]